MEREEADVTEIDAVRKLMLERAVARLRAEGKTEAEARAFAEEALAAPPRFPIPAIEGLGDPERGGRSVLSKRKSAG